MSSGTIDFKTNPVFRLLSELGVSTQESISLFHKGVRDSNEVDVYRCFRSGALFLSPVINVASSFENMPISEADTATTNAISVVDPDDDTVVESVAQPKPEDDQRRRDRFLSALEGKHWLDFGAGHGHFLDTLRDDVASAAGLEINPEKVQKLRDRGYQADTDLNAFEDGQFDVITFFHVLEHLLDPVATLSQLKSKLRPGGVVIAEVRHAQDYLLHELSCSAYRRFFFHANLILCHSRMTLAALASKSGFKSTRIDAQQRYGIGNHMYWLSAGKPGGHKALPELESPELLSAYEAMLAGRDQTDTLVAWMKV